ncbi:hypothetical protein BJQ94_18605 [Cryobacterium sp. SO2]|uniref:hypothetical protein n=1 Tax=Cryobacterium sp. SO2 TaxID=1897060 RepID=UPI00223DAA22|nr:hypothetical protein [Cryobacterium sp. SO2]WEO77333.1 hypothetical protein BJQ94_18605 [Cryobacterium sp. SO2]
MGAESVGLRAADLLAGPRGRRLCLETMLTLRDAETAATEELRTAVFFAAYDLDPERGMSRVLFGAGVNQRAEVPLAPTPQEVARLLDAAPLPDLDASTLLSALATVVDTARYWQEPDGEDVLAGTPEVRAALARVAEAIAAARGCVWWAGPMQDREQWVVTFADLPHIPRPPARTAREILDRWQGLQLEEEATAQRDRPADPAARFSGTWWSRPALGLMGTTRALPGHGPMGLRFVEDGLGWESATVERVHLPADARIFEIDGAAAWTDLVDRYPLEVTASRRHDWYRITGRSGTWVIPDWSRVRHDYDAVHLTVGGYLSAAGTGIRLDDDRATVLAGWDPDATYWLRDLDRHESTAAEWHLDDADGAWRPWPGERHEA